MFSAPLTELSLSQAHRVTFVLLPLSLRLGDTADTESSFSRAVGHVLLSRVLVIAGHQEHWASILLTQISLNWEHSPA